MVNKKLNQSKVVLKLLVVLKGIVEAGCEDVVDKEAVHKLFVKVLRFQAVLLDLSQTSKAKLKLIKVKAGKALLLKAILQKGFTSAKLKLIKVEAVKVLLVQALLQTGLSSAKLKLVKVEAVQCKGSVEALVCKAVLEAPP